MRKLITPAAIIMLFAAACSETPTNHTSKASTVANDSETDEVYLSDVVLRNNNSSEIDTSGIMMFPLGISFGESNRTKLSSYSSDSDASDYWNIIFYNTNTREQYLLSEQKMLIATYNSNHNNDNKHIYYSIITDNFNGDKVLDHHDPAYLFITDKQGKHLTQASPKGHHLRSWEYVESSNKIIMTVLKDSDNNHEFDKEDEVCVFEYQPGVSSAPAEVFTPTFKIKLKKLLKRDWTAHIKE